MATGFLLVCLLAGVLVPKTGIGSSQTAQSEASQAPQGETPVAAPAPEAAQA
jgi:hypothetical protein